MADLQPVRLGHSTGVAPFVMNRREPTSKGIVLGHNPRGPADRSVPILKVQRIDGACLAVLFGAACHNTTIPPSDNRVCGDFAGYAQACIESEFPGAQAMFMQGCGGDSGPYPTGSIELARRHGRTLGEEVNRVLNQDNLIRVGGPLRTVYSRIDLPLAVAMSTNEIEAFKKSPTRWKQWVGTMMEERELAGRAAPTHYGAPFAVWQFGGDLTLVALPGEVVVDYVGLLERELGPLGLWLAGYCNDVFGYLPSARVLREGGYETRGLYGGDPFAPEVERVTLNAVRKLARSAGRRLP